MEEDQGRRGGCKEGGVGVGWVLHIRLWGKKRLKLHHNKMNLVSTTTLDQDTIMSSENSIEKKLAFKQQKLQHYMLSKHRLQCHPLTYRMKPNNSKSDEVGKERKEE